MLTLNVNVTGQFKTHGIPYIKNYTIEDYRSNEEYGSPQNWFIYQDTMGMMYFANSGGLLYFDGIHWELIRVHKSASFRSVNRSADGKIYLGGEREFGYLSNDEKGKIVYRSLMHKIAPADQDFTDVWNIYTLPDRIVFETSGKVFVYENDTIKAISARGSIINTFQKGGSVYIFDTEQGLMRLVDNELVGVLDHDVFKSYGFKLPGFDDDALIVSRNLGFYSYKNEQLTKWPVKKEDIIISRKPYCGVKIDEDHIAIGTQLGGIFIINSKGKVEQVFNKENGLQANTVYYLFVDRNKNLWAALGNGISYLKINSPFTYFNPHLNIPRKIYDVEIVNDQIYFSSEVGVHVKSLPPINRDLKINKFRLIEGSGGMSYKLDRHQDLLLVANNSGVFLIKDGEIISRAFQGMHFWGIEKIPASDNEYLGMTENGLAIFRVKNNRIQNARKISGYDKTMRYTALLNDSVVWTTDEIEGISRLVLSPDKNRVVKSQFFQFSKQKSLHYPFVIEDRIFIATENNIYTISDTVKKVANELQRLNRAGGGTNRVNVDRWGRVWVMSDLVVKWFTPNNTVVEMPFFPFRGRNLIRISILSEDDVYFPSDNYVVHYDPNFSFDEENSQFNVLIKSISNINNDSIISTCYKHLFHDSLGMEMEDSVLILPYEKRNLRFQYAATYFEQPKETKYQVWLEGFESNNMNWTHETRKDYTNLRPGSYTFHVRAKNIYGVVSPETTLYFEIVPPWYLTIWAFIAYGVIGLMLFFLIIKLYTRQLKASNVKLENMVRERTQEIEAQNEEILSQSEQLMEVNEQLRKLSVVASEVDNAVIIMAPNGNIEWVNKGFERVYGLELYEVKNKNRATVFDYPNPEEITEIYGVVKKTKKSQTYELKLNSKRGERLYVNTTLTPLLNSDGEVERIIAIDSDITKLKQAEHEILQQKEEILSKNEEIQHQNEELIKHRYNLEELVKERTSELQKALNKAKESDRLKASFLTNMSHEIRTPMNAIIGYCELLEVEEDPAMYSNHINQIASNSNALLQLIDNIINLSRLESNTIEVSAKEFDLNELLDEIYEEFIDSFEEKGIALFPAKKDEHVNVLTDPQILQLVYTHSIQNALKYTESGEVSFGYKVQVIDNESQLVCYVQDTGIGMSPQDLDLVFKRFTKIEDDNRKLYRGAGVGLALCQRFVALLGGKIWIDSEEHKGTTVYFTFGQNEG